MQIFVISKNILKQKFKRERFITMKMGEQPTSEGHQRRRSGVFSVNCEHIF